MAGQDHRVSVRPFKEKSVMRISAFPGIAHTLIPPAYFFLFSAQISSFVTWQFLLPKMNSNQMPDRDALMSSTAKCVS